MQSGFPTKCTQHDYIDIYGYQPKLHFDCSNKCIRSMIIIIYPLQWFDQSLYNVITTITKGHRTIDELLIINGEI